MTALAKRIDGARVVGLGGDLEDLASHLNNPLVAHSRLDRWRADLAGRLWRQRSLLKRRGFVGADWDLLLDELEEFAFIEQCLRRSAHDRVAAPPQAWLRRSHSVKQRGGLTAQGDF
jgi:hypothetical protein